MTGDAPQPGETPRDEVDPWSSAGPGTSWWRTDDRGSAERSRGTRRRAAAEPGTPTLDPPQPAEHTGAAGAAHAAGTQDTLAALTGEAPAPAATVEIPDHPPLPAVVRTPEPTAAQTSEPRAAARTSAPRTAAPVGEARTSEPRTAEPAAPGPRAGAHAAPGTGTAEDATTESPAGAPVTARTRTGGHAAPETRTSEDAVADSPTGEHAAVDNPTGEHAPVKDRTGEHAVVENRTGEHAAPEVPADEHVTATTGTAAAGSATPGTRTGERRSGQRATRTTPPKLEMPAPARAATAGPADVQATTPDTTGEARGVERDHDQVDAERFNSAGTGTSYAARNRAEPPVPPEHEPTITDLLRAIPVEPPPVPAEPPADAERNRPTVALERGPVPGQSPTGLSRLGRARADRARADRALQDRVRHERTSALLETSPFWQAEEDRRANAWPPPETREKLANAGQPPRRRVPEPRHPAVGLLGLLALGLIAAFFAWVSAEPFWLAVGHGDRGTVTVARCTGAGVSQRCTGQFTAADGAYRVDDLALFGIEPAQRAPGSTAAARMVSSDSRQAYVGGPGMLMHLRWALSFVLVLLCGLGIAGLTGARRLDTHRARRGALLISLAGPLVLLAGFLTITY